jgi:predicted permease
MEVIGRAPERGRWFEPAMDRVGAGFYAVVSDFAWQNRFGSDPEIVGQTLRLNGQPVTIIGVGPPGYNGMGGFLVTDLWLSISSVGVGGDFRIANLDRRQDHWYDVKARLAEGVSVVQAQETMTALAERLAEGWPELNEGRDITVFSASDVRLHPDIKSTLYSFSGALLAVVFLVLVLASSNLGSLLLVRGLVRTPEMAVRRALGAAPVRVARLFLTEGLLLSVIGGVIGLVVAHWLLGLVDALPLPLPLGGAVDVGLDVRVLMASLALVLVTGVFFGWAPAMHAVSTNVSGALREDQRSTSGGRRISLFRNSMVSIQVAVSVVLVVGAGVMVRSLAKYQSVDVGIATDELAILQTSFSQAGLSPDERGMVLQELRDRVEALPGVERVALATRLPVGGGASTTTVVEGYEPQAGTGSVELQWIRVAPGYFETMGIPVVDGRPYRPEDRDSGEQIVVVNEAMARLWGGGSAIGRRIRPQGVPDAWVRVVGVVADSKIRNLAEPPTPMLYYLMGPSGADAPYILARTQGDPALLLTSLRSELRSVNSRLPVGRLTTMEGHLGEALAGPRMSAGVLGLFSLLALLLAGVGIYTIVSFAVAGRMGEIGIRVALGAQSGKVVRTVMGGVAATVGVGFVLGCVVVGLLSPYLQGLFYGVRILSLGTILPALAVLTVSVGLASYLPARRAARVDPVEALRAQ